MGTKVQEDQLSPKLFHARKSQVCCLTLMKNKDADKKNKETVKKKSERFPQRGRGIKLLSWDFSRGL